MERALQILTLLSVCGQIDGRKKFQKIVHILQEAGHPFDFSFGFHLHGPFSIELKSELDTLTAQNLLSEEAKEEATYTHYVYSASENAVHLLEEIKTEDSEPSWAGIAKELNQKSPQELEAISTVLYLKRAGVTNLKSQFDSLKPQLLARYPDALRYAEQRVLTSSANN